MEETSRTYISSEHRNGGASATRPAGQTSATPVVEPEGERALGAGSVMDALCGAGAVVLGILALIGFAPGVLTSVSAIGLGAALVASSVIPAHERGFGSSERSAVRAGEGAAAVQGLVGVGAVALGILALIGLARETLTLVAFLGIGAGMMLTGAALLAGAGFGHAHAHA